MDLFDAITEGRRDDIVALIASGADVNAPRDINQPGWTPIHHACIARGTSVGIVRILIEAGADFNKRGHTDPARFKKFSTGSTPLALAVLYRKFDIVKMLLAAGASPGCENSYPIAVRDGHRHILPLLLHNRCVPRPCQSPRNLLAYQDGAWAYHDKLVAAGGYDALVKKHRQILASIVDKVVEAKFRRRAPQEVCAHVALFISPPGGS